MTSSKPLPYTSNASTLLRNDLKLFWTCSFPWPIGLGLLSIVWPFTPAHSGSLDEISITWGNVYCMIIHFVLFIAQFAWIVALALSPLIGVPCPPLLSTPIFIVCVVAFHEGNQWFCRLSLSGSPGQKYAAGREYALNPNDDLDKWMPGDEKHRGERWVFINGVAVGQHWMNNNLKRLAMTFRRPILGIHNSSYGIIFDVLECMIQRTFCYATQDIRTAYKTISDILEDPKVKKLVLIAHSQGSIEAGMVLDWLYATLSREQVAKIEVYTFGNASNHWNCPMWASGQRVIEHVEHYANEGDWVSQFGVLHFRPLAGPSHDTPHPKMGRVRTALGNLMKRTTGQMEGEKTDRNRFIGRLFLRAGPGHQLNQHYLDNLFPMNADLTEVVDHGMDIHMNKEVDMKVFADDNTVTPDNSTMTADETDGQNVTAKIKDLSRLWIYRNGGVPEDWELLGEKTDGA